MTEAPIVRVVAQARYLGNVTAMNDAAAAAFADAVRPWLPFDNKGFAVKLLVTPDAGVVESEDEHSPEWIFHDGGDRRVTLTRGWVSYDVGPYESRQRFREDLEGVFAALAGVLGTIGVGRLGVRYINRIDDAGHLSRLDQLVRKELLGPLAAPAQARAIVHTLTQSLYELADFGAQLQVRNGLVPAGALIDPTVPAVAGPSWVLDLDAFTVDSPPLGVGLADRARELATVAYNYFHWAMTPEALRAFGGKS